MNKLILLLITSAIIITGLNITYSYADNDDDKFKKIKKQIRELELRIAELEFKTAPKLIESAVSTGDIQIAQTIFPEIPECNYLNIGTLEEPDNVALGWCPISSELVYWIEDPIASYGAIVLINIHRNSEFPSEVTPDCKTTFVGTKNLPLSIFTGFIVECNVNSSPYPDARDTLAYTVFPN